MATEAREIPGLEIAYTIFDGKIVYEASTS
jgi:hypothetical protein